MQPKDCLINYRSNCYNASSVEVFASHLHNREEIAMKLSAKEQRAIIHKALVSDNPEKALIELLVDTHAQQVTGVRARAAEALGDLDEISDMEAVKGTLLGVFEYEEEPVKRKAAIACAFLEIEEAVPIILKQLEKGVPYETAIPMLRALSVFQEESAREGLAEYARALPPWSGLVLYAALALGFLDIAKAKGQKMPAEEVWHRLP